MRASASMLWLLWTVVGVAIWLGGIYAYAKFRLAVTGARPTHNELLILRALIAIGVIALAWRMMLLTRRRRHRSARGRRLSRLG